ncbi:putative GPI anchored protein [Aspergillus fischeri NRRL 181]|uniref:GPI anchored protein, putative n=1 Tax=Neosartorya fischeri (strain ATCC 1020 / DSM 3700 / CBS 544.65 / FGSC A1164 / JCM 1740 / NRRL 181 / WB 181) TaxID=331117 RepID=A1CX01_NEOFI|nr:GPI anchored protein, putative [Aspergillus fischeri NRRL 181]EAW25153.1 GPI anchored protein, putative [Aspergillus fischeri NRRL 181]
MKGLVGGIPLALLVAAVANGHGEAVQEEGPVTLIGGPSGDDGGNSAAIGFNSSYSSGVKDNYQDDHSVDVNNTVVAAAPPRPPVLGYHKRDDPAVTFLKGPSGNDGGNSAEIEFDSSYASDVEDWYKDDHSLDKENHIITPPPIHGFRRRDDPSVTLVGGPSGNDGGNSVEVEFDSSYASAVKDSYKDDHSVDIDNHIVHPPPAPGFRKRGGGETTFFGGPSGDDGGNSASFEFDSSYASSVKDAYKDDHSVDVKNTIIHPPPVFHPPSVPGFHKRDGGDTTFFGGPSGDDGGNSAEVEFESAYVSSVEDYYKDDHSVDVENHIIHPPPVFHPPPVRGFRKREGGDTVFFDGPSGDDGGNSASFEFDSSYDSSVKDVYKDDHSVDVKNTVIHPPPVFHPPPVRGFRKREGGDTVFIDGPSGDDGGNSASFEFDSSYASSVKDAYKDDHSVDVKNTVIHPPPVFHPPPVPGFRKRDDGGSHIGTPNSHKLAKPAASEDSGKSAKDGGITFIKGPSGNDGGNSADVEFDSNYGSAVEDYYKDDHSVDIKNHIVAPPAVPKGFRKRGSGPVFFDGPSGDDEGNDADFLFDNDYSSKVDSHYVDDHSVKAENWIVHVPPPPPPPRPQPPHPQGPPFLPPHPQGTPPQAAPPPFAGNAEPPRPQAPPPQAAPPPFASNQEAPRPQAPAPQAPAPQAAPPPFAGNPEPPHGVAPVASEPCSTSTFIETVIKTLADKPVATKPAAPYRPPEHSQPHVPQPKAPSDPNHGFEPTHPAEAVPTGVSPTHEVEAPKGHENPGFQKPEPARPSFTTSKVEAHPQPTVPSYPPQGNPQAHPEGGAPAGPGHGQPQGDAIPCPTGRPGGHQPEPAAPAYQPHQPQDADPKEAPKHAATAVEPLTSITSTITVSHTSSFAVVPVYMDSNHKTSCTSGAHQRPTDVDAHDNHHAPSSAHSQAVKPTHHAAPSPTPSQSMLFTGAAGRITPAAGVVSAVCGLMAVLAFVL